MEVVHVKYFYEHEPLRDLAKAPWRLPDPDLDITWADLESAISKFQYLSYLCMGFWEGYEQYIPVNKLEERLKCRFKENTNENPQFSTPHISFRVSGKVEQTKWFIEWISA